MTPLDLYFCYGTFETLTLQCHYDFGPQWLIFSKKCLNVYCLYAENKLQHHHPTNAKKTKERLLILRKKRKLIMNVWICHLGRASEGNGRCNHQQREVCGEAFTHINTCMHFFIKTESRVAQDKDKKKWNRKLLRTNRPKSRHPICLAHKQSQTSTKSNKESLQQPRAIWGNSWFLPVFHKGAVIYSHVDDNLIMINSRTVQSEPQQVWDVDTGHTKWVREHYPVVPCRIKNRLIDFHLLLERKEREEWTGRKSCNTILSGHLSN